MKKFFRSFTMAKPTPVKSTKSSTAWTKLRAVTVGVLVGIAGLSVAAFSMVHWTEQRVLNTDNWVAMVGNLPKDPTVSTALGTYLAGQLIEAVNVKQRLTEALPPQAGFIVDPLVEQLRTIANGV